MAKATLSLIPASLDVLAEIKVGNIASERVASKIGLTHQHTNDGIMEWRRPKSWDKEEEAVSYRVLLLTSSINENNNPLQAFLEADAEVRTLTIVNQKFKAEDISGKFDIAVSYGYRYILRQCQLDEIPIFVNMHIAYLPWNKGADPNLWSLISRTPSGVTIHHINSGVDTGDIIAQEKVEFDMKEGTLRTSYNNLKLAIEDLFYRSWGAIKNGTAPRIVQDQNAGTLHRMKDKKSFFDRITPNGWDTKLSVVLSQYDALSDLND